MLVVLALASHLWLQACRLAVCVSREGWQIMGGPHAINPILCVEQRGVAGMKAARNKAVQDRMLL